MPPTAKIHFSKKNCVDADDNNNDDGHEDVGMAVMMQMVILRPKMSLW